MLLIVILAILILAVLVGVWYARRPKPLPPPVITPTFEARIVEDGHHYRMRLPDRLKLEHHR